MPWYSLSRPSGNNTFTIYSYSPGIPFPYKYENIIFDESNPNRIAFGAYSGGSGYINSILIPPSTTSSKYNNVFKAVDSNSFIQSAPCGIFFLKNEANAYVEPVIFDKIRGKFKLKYSIENFRHIENNIGTAFKINCNVNGVSYTNMCISSSPDWKIFSRSNPTYSTNTKFLYFYNDLPVLTGDDNFTNINKPKDLLIINLKESNNVIIDFGDYEQDIPSIMLEDFVINAEIIYDNIYTIKSTTGSTLTTLTEAPPMTSATLSAVGNAKYLTLKGENNTNYAMEWTSETPQGKIFAGLATSKGGSIVIPVGETSTINLTESTDLYEVWQTYRPPTTTFDINLYKNSAEPNKVDKTAELSTVGTISGVLRQECSLIGPEIIIQYDKPPDFNYCYIANFGRYYYVENIVSMRQNLWRVRLRCDVLMTYKTQILNLNARIARQQYTYSYRQIDSEIPFTNDPEITVQDIPNSLNLGKPHYENILLTVVGNGT